MSARYGSGSKASGPNTPAPVQVPLASSSIAITGLKPKGTKPVARTQLMGVARVVLFLLALAVAYFAFASRS